ncbi:hypothetical protein [Paracoccus fontiphilus]|uniref:Uncharacterized protein n=1 Tax=Paracoccus fontiphilus TaxID=1815556 RepID=A0ABV7IDD6_9RHOB|nr:hypothetical protein [Paracoccus fontiphilus]
MKRVGRMSRGQDPAHRLPVAAMMIQAAEEKLVPFYEKLKFSGKSKEQPLMLTRPIADIEALLAADEAARAVGRIADEEGARPVAGR